MKLFKALKHLTTRTAFTLLVLGTAAILPAGTALAANVQEEGFILSKNVTEGTAYTHDGTAAKDGETVGLEIYYHDLESPDSGIDALNVHIKVGLPTNFETNHSVTTSIKADNSNEIDDSANITTSDATQLQFIPGSVTWRHDVGTNANPQWVTTPIADTVVTNPNGAIIDQDQKPCNNFAATIAFQAKIVAQPTPPPQNPVFTCDAFNITADVNRTVKVSTFSTTATNGAVFNNAVVDWGDKSSPLTNANIVGQSHQYAADGTYTITATAHFTVNGHDVTASGPQCQKSVTFKSNTPPVVTPPTTPPPATPAAPTALVNTGPGSIAGLFAATTAAGTVAYRWMLGRRLSRQ